MIILILFMLLVMAVAIIIAIQIITAPKINAMVWKHPENGGGIKLENFKQKSPNQPFWIKLHWWQFNEKPIYLWYEEKVTDKDGKVTFKMCAYEPRPETNMSPNGLFDNVDWECAHVFESVSSKLMETIKMGMAVAMVAICVIGVIMLSDMLGKNKASANINTPPPVSYVLPEGK